jgi:hypothetical protein
LVPTVLLIEYYANLLILQYLGKPKAYATIEELANMAIMDQLPLLVQDAFDLETAEGVQLDKLGEYAGVSRVGFDFSGPVSLNDTDFRLYIKLAIVQNSAGSSLSDIQSLLSICFPATLFVFDFANMHMGYFLDSNEASTELAEFFVRQGALPKPMGVQLAALIYGPNIDNWFGFRTYYAAGFNNHGFNTYSVYDTDCHWLEYDDTISF